LRKVFSLGIASKKALEMSRQGHGSLVTVLVRDHFIAEDTLLKILAEHQGVRFVNLKETGIDENAVKTISASLPPTTRSCRFVWKTA